MKRSILYVTVTMTAIWLLSCNSRVRHADDFYNYNESHFPYAQFPLIKPYIVYQEDSKSPWIVELKTCLWIDLDYYQYCYYEVHDVWKLSVKNGVIVTYSPYIDEKPFDNEQANQVIRDNYYHWFVIIPEKNVEIGFDSEIDFLNYVRKFGIEQPDWGEPKDIFIQFENTGCLVWIPDCAGN